MRALIFIWTILFAQNAWGQGHTDVKEYGYKGPVKRITTLYFDTLSFDKANEISNKKLWRNQVIYKFDPGGNLDSILTYTQLPMYTDTVYMFKTAYFNESPSRFAVRFDGNNVVTDTIKYVWLSDTSYHTTETAVDGSLRIRSYLLLDRNYRDKAGKYTGNDEKGSILFSEKYENTIDENGFLTGSVKTNLLKNSASMVDYRYFDFDKYGNPTRILLTSLPDKKVFRIILRTFEYY